MPVGIIGDRVISFGQCFSELLQCLTNRVNQLCTGLKVITRLTPYRKECRRIDWINSPNGRIEIAAEKQTQIAACSIVVSGVGGGIGFCCTGRRFGPGAEGNVNFCSSGIFPDGPETCVQGLNFLFPSFSFGNNVDCESIIGATFDIGPSVKGNVL